MPKLCKKFWIRFNNPQTITEMKKNAMIKNFGWDVEDGSLYKYYNLLRFGHL